jgi:DNA-binding transcriptional MerR regulator
MHPMADESRVPADNSEIPDKLYFRIGEVAKLAGIKPYVLRFWETEFGVLEPKKSGTGHRLYRRKDVEMVLEIKRLLYEKRFTIEGARKFLESKSRPLLARMPAKRAVQGQLFGPNPDSIREIRRELAEIVQVLSRNDGKTD